MKLVHKSLTAWIFSVCICTTLQSQPLPVQGAVDAPEYLRFYNSDSGFKPAQPNLTNIFLQLAGSLEAHGSPEPYIRHVISEYKRVAALYEDKTGRKVASHLPSYMTPEYIDQLIDNWKLMEQKLKLDILARSCGQCIRAAILGSKRDGTILAGILDSHQQLVANAIQRPGNVFGFDQLRATLIAELEIEGTPSARSKPTTAEMVRRETALSEAERSEFAVFISRERFTKADFPALERFYSGPYDKLSEEGKSEMSKRIQAGMRGGDPNTRLEVITIVQGFRAQKDTLFKKIEAAIEPERARKLKEVINGVFLDVGRLAHSEVELAIIEASLK